MGAHSQRAKEGNELECGGPFRTTTELWPSETSTPLLVCFLQCQQTQIHRAIVTVFKSHVNFLIKSQSAKPRRGDSQGWDEKKECGSEVSLLGGSSGPSLHSALGCYTASMWSFTLVFKMVITYKQVPMLSRAQLLSRLVDISFPMRNSPREDGK